MNMEVTMVSIAMVALLLLLLLGHFVRNRVGVLRSLFLPSSIVAGLLAVLIGPQVLGAIITHFMGPAAPLGGGLLPGQVLEVWSEIPVLLISVVFATLFLGKTIPNLREILSIAGPVVTYGQVVAWGQYVCGILLSLLILTPIFGLPPMAGALIEISFEGGHGTAAGLSPSFTALGFEEGVDLALGLATVGVVMGVVLGIVLVNWAVRSGIAGVPRAGGSPEEGEISIELKPVNPFEEKEYPDIAVEPLSIHLGIVALAIAIGWILLQLLIYGEELSRNLTGFPDFELMRYIPLFPLAMIGGVVLQIALGRVGLRDRVNRALVNQISGTALDILILAAVATLSLAIIEKHFIPFLILAITGIAWNTLAFLYLSPRLIRRYWFERGIPNFGQGMGMTATGLLLARMADPDDRTLTVESFGYKQLLFEPIVGGGLFTAASLPLIFQFGPVAMLGLTAALMIAWLLVGYFAFIRGRG